MSGRTSSGASTASGMSALTKGMAMTTKPPSIIERKPRYFPTKKHSPVEKDVAESKVFDGREEKLSGLSYGTDSANTFINTVDELLQYACTKYEHGDALAQAYDDGNTGTPTFPRPRKPKADETSKEFNKELFELEVDVWREKVKLVAKREIKYESESKQFYNVVWGQCTEWVQNKVKTLEEYDEFCTYVGGRALMYSSRWPSSLPGHSHQMWTTGGSWGG